MLWVWGIEFLACRAVLAMAGVRAWVWPKVGPPPLAGRGGPPSETANRDANSHRPSRVSLLPCVSLDIVLMDSKSSLIRTGSTCAVTGRLVDQTRSEGRVPRRV
jgi:hypothetical protein